MTLEIGKCYTRGQIHDRLGGGVQDYLPHQDLQVVCGCLKTDTNPNAPDVVLPGKGPSIQRWAKVFRDQRHPVPIFLKQAINAWKYVGDYQVDRWTEDHSEIAAHAKRAARNDVTSVLFLKRHDS